MLFFWIISNLAAGDKLKPRNPRIPEEKRVYIGDKKILDFIFSGKIRKLSKPII